MTNTERYITACHAMQTGVAMVMRYGLSQDHTLKHLRTGVNSSMVEHGALLELMVDKGIITLDEYEKYLADAMEREVKLYEEQLSAHLGKPVKLI